MTEYERRDVLKGTGLAIAAGTAPAWGVVTANETAAEEGNDGTTVSSDSNGWVSTRGNAGNTGYVSRATGPEPPVTTAWEYDHGGPFAVVDGTIYLTADGQVHAVDATDGSLEWKNGVTREEHAEPMAAAGSPAVAYDTVYVSGERGNPDLTALDAVTGEIRWQLGDLGYETNLAPIVADERVFLVADRVLYCLDAHTGEKQWSFEPEPATFDDDREHDDPLQRNPVAVADGTVFVLSNNRLFARDVETGDERWTDTIRENWAASTFSGPAVAADGFVAVVKADTVTIFETDTGTERATVPGHSVDALTDDRIYTVRKDDTRDDDEHRVITGYDRKTGDGIWLRSVRALSLGTVAVDDKSVYVGFEETATETGVVAFNHANGDQRWKINIDARPHQVAVIDETVYASGDALHAIRSAAEDENEDAPEDEAETPAENETNTPDDEGVNSSENETTTVQDGTDNSSENETPAAQEGERNSSGDETTATENESETAPESGATDSDDGTDGTPGFTTGVGVAGGALSLEWLRRRAVADEGDGERKE
ncbi:PQQ-binding-like beta-propeller repeat protein [Natronorubrum halophilum]|uniref:PQQ-binding-like beta-propeller repeat protein n=1 Tax=Natronorubrum halophilum TaxID=1702106 RepID=UPI0010C17E6F|nr:PQQ-binding-like beta-propeller repeat protein [Natronorubrum halophilum]